MSFVRNSKYRHIFGNASKDLFTGVKVTRNSADSKFCAVNPKFVAIVVQGAGGGPFLVLPLDKFGRLPTDQPYVNGHTDKVIELAWSPFNDNLIASCSEDCSIKLWEIPDEGLKDTLTECWRELNGHEKRVSLLEWHPSAEYILASGSSDNTVIVWNVKDEELKYRIKHPDVPQCISWNLEGCLIATTCKDKTLRVIDPRKESIIQEKKNFFDGSKPSKCVFLKDGKIFCVGFSRMSSRLYNLWDSKVEKPGCAMYDMKYPQGTFRASYRKDLSEALATEEVDNANGTVYLHYDPDNNVIFTIGKGDSQIKYYEVTEEEPYIHFLSLYQSTSSQRGFAWMPKRGLNFTSCEIARCYKLHEDKCEPISLIVPRKSDLFQEDIYPPCLGDQPALTEEQWLAGKNAKPLTVDIKPMFDELKASKGSVGSKKTGQKPLRTLSQRPAKSLPAAAPAHNGASIPSNINFEELVDDVKKLKSTVRKVCRRLSALEKRFGEAVADDDGEEE